MPFSEGSINWINTRAKEVSKERPEDSPDKNKIKRNLEEGHREREAESHPSLSSPAALNTTTTVHGKGKFG